MPMAMCKRSQPSVNPLNFDYFIWLCFILPYLEIAIIFRTKFKKLKTLIFLDITLKILYIDAPKGVANEPKNTIF